MIEIIPNWHPLFVHFTIALLSVSVLFFILERPFHETIMGDNFLVFARYSLILGIAFTVLTVVAGWSAYNSVDHDTPSHLAMTDHRNWALGTFATFVIAGIWLSASTKVKEGASIVFILYLLIGAGLLGVTGFKGAELVYKFGLGVQSLPEKSEHGDGHGHAHEHQNSNDHQDSHDHQSSLDHQSIDAQVDDDMTMDSMSMDELEDKEPVVKEMPIEEEEDGITRQKLAP